MKKLNLVLASLLALIVPARAADYFLTQAGSGTKNGSSWANAYSVTSLSTVLNSTMQSGDTLYLGGPEVSGGVSFGDARFTITSSGAAGAQKNLVGVDRGFGYPSFLGAQTVRSYTTITLADTVSYWTIKNLLIEKRDLGIATAGTGHLGLVFEGITIRNVRSKGFSLTDCDNLLIQNCRVERYSEIAFRFNHSCDGVTVRNCMANCTAIGTADEPSWRTGCSDPVGYDFHVKGSTAAFNTNILLEDCETMNNNEDTGESYEQGDGFKMEGRNDGVTLRNCKSSNNQDAGYDLKGANQTLKDCFSLNNFRYGFKVWYDGNLNNCISANNGAWQFILPATSTGKVITADYCTFHCKASPQGGVLVETAGNTAVLKNSIISFGGTAATYTAGSGSFSLTETVKLANAANTANSPKYINPVLPWDGEGTDFDNQTYGLTKGFNSTGVHTLPPPSVIVDNSDATGVTIAGAWTASASSPGYQGSNYLHDDNTGKGTKTVRFTPALPIGGSYEVFAKWTSGTNRASNVPIDITHASGTDYVVVDQRSNGSMWISLGVYDFVVGGGGNVLIGTTGTSGYVIADAIQFVLIEPAEIVMDNTDATGVTISGVWTSSTFTPGYQGTDYLHDDNAGKGAKSVRFAPAVSAAGSYEVFARWTSGSNRASNVPIDITHSTGVDYVQLDQRANGGQWVSLGVYIFAAGSGGNVLIGTAGTTGFVIADAIRMVPVTP